MAQVPELSYNMFTQDNSIARAVEGKYNLTANSLTNWDAIVAAVIANGQLSDFDPTYAPASFSTAAINNSDLFRLFPSAVGTCNVRYNFVNNLPSPSTKSNTVFVDLFQFEVDESDGTYVCDVDGTPYDGIEGFVSYTITAADLANYPNGIRLRAWETKTNQTFQAERTSTGFFRLDYATGPIYDSDTRFFVYIEEIDDDPSDTIPVYGQLVYEGYDATFNNTGAKVFINGNGYPTTYTQELNMTSSSGGSASITQFDILKNVSFYVNSGGFAQNAIATGIIYTFDVTFNLYNATSGGGKGSLIESNSKTVNYNQSSGAPITGSVASELMIFNKDDLASQTLGAYFEIIVGRLGSINT